MQLLWIFNGGDPGYAWFTLVWGAGHVLNEGKLRKLLLNMSASFLPDSTESWRGGPLLTGLSPPFGTGTGNWLNNLTRRCEAICHSSGRSSRLVISWIYLSVKDNKLDSVQGEQQSWNGTQSHNTESTQTPEGLRTWYMNQSSYLKVVLWPQDAFRAFLQWFTHLETSQSSKQHPLSVFSWDIWTEWWGHWKKT